jgi:hypothetical protein
MRAVPAYPSQPLDALKSQPGGVKNVAASRSLMNAQP